MNQQAVDVAAVDVATHGIDAFDVIAIADYIIQDLRLHAADGDSKVWIAIGVPLVAIERNMGDIPRMPIGGLGVEEWWI